MRTSSQASVMNFLNEIAGDLPSSVSLAAGRPTVHLLARLTPKALEQLLHAFSDPSDHIRWNRLSGGFFLSLDLSFQFDAHAVTECSTDYGVIVMPMSFFALGSSQDQRVRLALSTTEPSQICECMNGLSHYIAPRIIRENRSAKNGQKRLAS